MSVPSMAPRQVLRSTLFAAWLATSIVAASCSSGGRAPTDTGVQTRGPTTPEVVVDDGIGQDNRLDQAVFDQLTASGFRNFEADCVARRISLLELVAVDADSLLTVFADCGIELERLIEVGPAR